MTQTNLFNNILYCSPTILRLHETGEIISPDQIDTILQRTNQTKNTKQINPTTIEQILERHQSLFDQSHAQYNMHNAAISIAQRIRTTVHNPSEMTAFLTSYLRTHGKVKDENAVERTAQAIKGSLVKEQVYQPANQQQTNIVPTATIHNDGSIVLDIGTEIVARALRDNIQTIPVEIIGRMSKWREIVTNLSQVYSGKKLYQPINHPEFNDWEIARGNERIDLINPHFPTLQGKRVLDVGCCLGHFSRWAYNKNAEVVGIEGFKTFYETAKMLNHLENTDVRYDRSGVVEWLHKDKSQFDLIVCLSIIHNIAQQGHPEQAKWALQELSQRSPRMIFDIGEEGEKGDQVSKLGLGLTKSNLPEFIRQNSMYTTIQKIGTETTYCHRDIYILSR